MALLMVMIFEVPYFNLFLIAGFLMLISYIVIYRRHSLANAELLILLLFIVLYFAIDTNLETSNEYKFWYSVSTVSLYACGYSMNYATLNIEERSRKIEYIIRRIAMAYTAFVLITVVYSAIKGQFGISRNPLNFWTGTLRAATHYGTMSVFPLAYGLYLAIVAEGKKEHRTGWLLVVFATLVAIVTASRTVLLLVPVGAIVAYFTNIGIRGKVTMKNICQLIGVIVLLGLSIVVFKTGLFGIQTAFFKTQLGQRYLLGHASTLTDDERWRKMEFFIHNIDKSVWGGGYARVNVGNLHNVYLNVFDLSGIIPFALLLVFTGQVMRDYRRMRRNGSVTIPVAVLLFLVLLLSFIQMLIEPTMESVPAFMWCLLMICGMQCKVSRCKEYIMGR